MGQVLFAGEEPQKCPPLLRIVIANRPTQHGIARLKCVQYRALRDRILNFERHLSLDMRQSAKMIRKAYTNHRNSFAEWLVLLQPIRFQPLGLTLFHHPLVGKFRILSGNVERIHVIGKARDLSIIATVQNLQCRLV